MEIRIGFDWTDSKSSNDSPFSFSFFIFSDFFMQEKLSLCADFFKVAA